MIFKIKQKKLKINGVVIITYKQYLTERFFMDKQIEGDPYKTAMGFDMWRIKNHQFMEREWDLYIQRIEEAHLNRYK